MSNASSIDGSGIENILLENLQLKNSELKNGGPHDGPADLVRILRQRAKLSPQKNVFSFLEEDGKVGQSFSYADLDLRARVIAAKLAASGQPGDRVLLLYPPSLEFIAGFFGCLYAGMIAVPAYPPKNNRHMLRLKAILDDADSVLALTKQGLSEKIQKLALEQQLGDLMVISSDALDETPALKFTPILPTPDQVAFLQYTSGSTGNPKGVMVSHGNLAHNSSLIQKTWGHGPRSVMVSWLPLFHDLGLIAGVLQPVFAGFPSVLMAPATFLQKPLLWLQAISRFKGTSSCAPNFAFDYCVKKISEEDKAGLDLSSWQLALNAAEPIRHKTLSEFCKAFGPAGFRPGTFFPGYGLAEGTLQVCVSKLGRGAEIFMADPEALESNQVLEAAPGAKSRPVVGCGQVLEDAQISIVDPLSCLALGPDAVGEVWIAGPSVAQGYWRNLPATQEIFKARIEGRAGLFLRTGDLGFIRNGELFLTGRCKDLLIIRGRNHYPQDLEQSAEFSHNALRSNGGAAFSVEHSGEERVVLVHEIERNREGDTDKILDSIKKALLRDHEVSPHAIVLIKTTSLPKTSSGKIQRRATKKAFLDGSLDVIARWDEGVVAPLSGIRHEETAPAAAEGEVFQRLAELVSLKLKLDPAKVASSDTLQSLGMDSLSLIEFKHALEESFGMECSLEELLEGPTLLELSRRLAVSLPQSGDFRLTPAQESLWFFEQLHAGAPLYNIAAAWQMEGALDVAALQKGLEEILRRHEALRTGFKDEGGSPSAFVAQASAWDWKEEELGHLEPAEAEKEFTRLSAQEAKRRFDLSLPPLFRARLYRLPAGRHALLLVVHHLVSDGWSFKLLWEELSELYDSSRRGFPAKLKALTRSFADWAEGAESRGSLQSLDYWKSKFSDLPARLDLPGDRPLPSQQDFQGGSFSFDLGEAFSHRLKSFAKELGSNPFGVFLASYQVLLQRLSRQRDLCVGVPAANRSSKACSQVMGYFVNTLALRQSLDPAQSFRQHLLATQDNLRSALGHQDLPFERLVRELGLEPDSSSHPLFQALLVFQGPNPAPQHLDSLKISALDVPSGSAKLDLALSLEERQGSFHGVFEYRLDIFDPETIRRWAGHYLTLLESAFAAPHAALGDLGMLKPQEAGEVLALAAGPIKPLMASKSFKNLFERGVRQHPAALALRWNEETWTYAELNQRANRLAHALQAWGVGRESLVALCFERGPESLLAALAVLKAGGAFLPLDPSYPKDRLDFILKDAAVPLLLTQEALQARHGLAAPKAICLDTQWDRISHFGSDDPIAMSQPSDLAYVIYTSGSTGKPKGVQLEHLGLWNLIQAVGADLGLALGTKALQFASPGFDASVWEIFPALAYGACLVLASKEQTHNPELLVRLCQEESVELATLPPSLLQHMSPQSLPGLRCLVSAGESCSAELARLWSPGRRFINAYGPTESTVCSSLHACDPQSPAAPSIGRPLANLRAYVVDERGHVQALGVPGELWIGGPAVARGYLGRPELTREKFIQDPFAAGTGKLFRSGDLARWRPDGNLEFMGRMDSQVKLRGFRIELGEVEAVLASLPGVKEVAVLVEGGGQAAHLAAYVAAEPGLEEDALRQGAAARLPEFMLPSVFHLMERLPLNVNGKVDRAGLARLPQGSREPSSPPAGQLDLALKRVFAEVLGIPEAQVGMEKSFFSMGGHSLLAVKLAAAVHKQFGVKLDLAQIFEKPSVLKLSSLLSHRKSFSALPDVEALPKLAAGGVVPTLGQEALWFFDQLKPGSPVYNMPIAWRIRGPLDLESLRSALADLAKRHESLRTIFESELGRPVCKVLRPEAVQLGLTDLEVFSETERPKQLKRALQEDLSRAFDLGKGPLLRANLYRLEARDHALLVNVHHICADGWSLEILMNELKEFYAARLENRAPVLPGLTRSYADYSAWQRRWLDSAEAADQARYWQSQLSGVAPVLELPLDKPRPALQSFEGSSVAFQMDPGLFIALKGFCTEKGTTSQTVLLTAFSVLLQRLSRQDEFVCGIPVANRRFQETEPVAGLFMNMLPIRFSSAENPAFSAALAGIEKNCVAAMHNQDLPFEKLVHLQQSARDPSVAPLVQVLLSYQRREAELAFSGCKLEKIELQSQAARLDLSFFLEETQDGISGILEYASSILERGTAKRWLGHFQVLLKHALAQPELKLSELPLLAESDKKNILVDWNATDRDYPRHVAVHELFEMQAKLNPDLLAAREGELSISYGDLNEKSNKLARHLRGLGVGAETPVGLFVERSLDMLVGMLAIVKSGGAYVPLDTAHPQERLEFILNDTEAPVLLTQKALLGRLPKSDAGIFCLDSDFSDLEFLESDNLAAVTSEQSLAYIMYTSGSTGQPKGVCVLHQGINRIVQNNAYLQFSPQDVVGQVTNHSFDLSTNEIWGALTNGASLAIIPKEALLDAGEIYEAFRRNRVTTVIMASSIFNNIVSQDPEVFGVLKTLVLGGEALDPKWVGQSMKHGRPSRLVNAYGPTECTVWSTSQDIEDIPDLGGSISIGKPISNDQAYVLDEAMRPCAIGIPGELYLGGDGLARGYWRREALTAEKFVSNPFDPQRSPRLYRTGDLARWLPDGRLDFLGRLDSQIKLNGHRIELGEIESVLGAFQGVQSCAVLALKAGEGDRRLAAYLSYGPGSPLSADEIKKYLKAKLPDYMVPSHFVFLPQLPLNSNGKIDRKALAAISPFESQPQGAAPAAALPSDAVERAVLGIWKRVLKQDQLGVKDNFFESGGHSLLAVQVVSLAKKELGYSLSLGELFQHPTVAAMSALLKDRGFQAKPSGPLVCLRQEGQLQPLFLVHPIGGSVYCYRQLASEVKAGRPIFAFEAEALLDSGAPMDDLAALALKYVEALCQQQAQGPYHLAGWSFGGVVAFEMARILEARGQEIAFLGLFDSRLVSEKTRKQLANDPAMLASLFVHDIGSIHGVSPDFSRHLYADLGPEEQLDYLVRVLRGNAAAAEGIGREEVRRLLRVFKAHMQALWTYRPGSYGGRLTLFLAEEGLRQSAILDWASLCQQGMELNVVSGNHYSMLNGTHGLALKFSEKLELSQLISRNQISNSLGRAS